MGCEKSVQSLRLWTPPGEDPLAPEGAPGASRLADTSTGGSARSGAGAGASTDVGAGAVFTGVSGGALVLLRVCVSEGRWRCANMLRVAVFYGTTLSHVLINGRPESPVGLSKTISAVALNDLKHFLRVGLQLFQNTNTAK